MDLAIRAFPKRWRVANGEEFLATAAQLEADGLSRRYLLELVDTVLAGVDVRLRTRPPLRHRVAYRLWNKPVPARWHGWMRDDLSSRWVGPRAMLFPLIPLLAYQIWVSFTLDGYPSPWIVASFYLVVIVGGARFKSRQIRRHVYRKAGWAKDGSILSPPEPEASFGPQES
jgi:hypothetical protein